MNLQKLSEILAQDDILSHFEGVEVVPDGVGQKTVNCYLALTRTHIHVLHQAEKVFFPLFSFVECIEYVYY